MIGRVLAAATVERARLTTGGVEIEPGLLPRLRPYQVEAGRAIVDSVMNGRTR